MERGSRRVEEWKWRRAFGIAIILGSGIVLYAVSQYEHNHPFGIDFVDTFLQSSPITELAGSLIVIPVVYLLIESGLDRAFKEEIRETLRDFAAEPTSIIPYVEADKLGEFTSKLLDKIFFNQNLSEAFVKNIDKHRDRLLNPIIDYRVESFISDHSDEYFKIDTTFMQNKRNRNASNVVIACKKISTTDAEMFTIDVYESLESDFVWNFVPCGAHSKLSDSNFKVTRVAIDGDEIEMFEDSTDERIVFRSREIANGIDMSSLLEISFSVLQRRSLAGVSYGVSRPVSSLTVDFTYSDMKIDKVDVWSNLAGVGATKTIVRHDNRRKL